jgi:hypothetical protein
MPDYRFTIHGDKAPEPATVSLPDDDSAWDYGESMVRRLLNTKPREREAWSLDITEGSREIANIALILRDSKSAERSNSRRLQAAARGGIISTPLSLFAVGTGHAEHTGTAAEAGPATAVADLRSLRPRDESRNCRAARPICKP